MARPDLVLIHPPAARPAEPPLGTAVLLSHLRRKGAAAEAIDANLEAHFYLLDGDRLSDAAGPAPATALHRAMRTSPGALLPPVARGRSLVPPLLFRRAPPEHGVVRVSRRGRERTVDPRRLRARDLSEFSIRDLSLAASGKRGPYSPATSGTPSSLASHGCVRAASRSR